ncbi:MAG TPA: hypothetical protein HPP83_05335 [Candidatus Hydrogenedentes bacterium]|nr:hypothetical protein [Candidatus Hydrogenedentota bacterium]
MNWRRSVPGDAEFLLVALAALWPWEAYGFLLFIPGLHVTLIGFAAFGVIALWAYALVARWRLQLPFELAWPTLALLALIWAAAALGKLHSPFLATGCVLLFVAAARFGRAEGLVERALWTSCLSGGAVAGATLWALISGMLPVAPWVRLGVPGVDARELAGSGLGFVLCLAMAIHFAFSGVASRTKRVAAAISGALILAALVGVVANGLGRSFGYIPPRYFSLDGLSLATLLSALWIFARVAAKAEVQRRESPRPIYVLFLAMAGLAAFGLAWLPAAPRLSHGLLMGLVCAGVVPGKRRAAEVSRRPGAEIAAVGLVAGLSILNLAHVFPANERHPWNYESAARRDFPAARYRALEQRMDVFERRWPNETRTHYWRAKAALARGLPHRAAREFARALRSGDDNRTLFPSPSDPETNDFVTRLRDCCSAAPEPKRLFAFERALVARGNTDSALAVLEHQTTADAASSRTRFDATPLADAAAFLLGDMALSERLAAWPAPKVLALLENWGATVTPAPQSFPAEAAPFVVVAQLLPDQVELFAGAANGSRSTQTWERPERDYGATAWNGGGWTLAPAEYGETPRIELRIAADTDGRCVAELRIAPDGALDFRRVATPIGPTPDTPAILVLLP